MLKANEITQFSRIASAIKKELTWSVRPSCLFAFEMRIFF